MQPGKEMQINEILLQVQYYNIVADLAFKLLQLPGQDSPTALDFRKRSSVMISMSFFSNKGRHACLIYNMLYIQIKLVTSNLCHLKQINVIHHVDITILNLKTIKEALLDPMDRNFLGLTYSAR